MIFREARLSDIPQMQILRHAVRENRLSDPSLVTDLDCENYLTLRGRGWVAETDDRIRGFAIIDIQDKNIWALFVDPDFEGLGIGRTLQQIMLDWYFTSHNERVWLGTAPGTRAEQFYRKSGWTDKGMMKNKEMRFEMDRAQWLKSKLENQAKNSS